jgi:CheY-like chemotaxis protein
MVDYTPIAKKKYDVLVVDDDTDWGSEFATKTENEGLVVLCFTNPDLAQEYLNSCPREYAPDLGIIDMRFPGFHENAHLAVAYLLERLNPTARTIFVTGNWSIHDEGSMDSPHARNSIAYTKVDTVEGSNALKVCTFVTRFAQDRSASLENFFREFPPSDQEL